MLYTNPLQDLMQEIRKANPDVDTLELEGMRMGDIRWDSWGPIMWRVRVSFNDGDFFVTELFQNSMDAMIYTKNRLAKWVGK